MSELNDLNFDPKKDPLSPIGKDCTICDTEYEDDDWGMMGWIGILPLSLCPNCSSGIFHMVLSTTSPEDLEEAAAIQRMEAE